MEFHKVMGLLIAFAIWGVQSQEEVVDCSNEDVVTSIFNKAIDLRFNGTIRTYERVNISSIVSTTNNEFEKKYIDARLEMAADNSTKNLVIFTTEEFSRYAAEQTAARITLKIAFGCDMGRERTLIFFQPILEGNYFSPLFTRDVYEIVMPTPIFASFDLTNFMEIAARDDDLTNNQVMFSSNEAEALGLVVGTKNQSQQEGKLFLASVKLTRIYLSLPNELRFNITAMDTGNPPLNSTATVIIRPDPVNNLPPLPKFEQSLYNATLSSNLSMYEPLLVRLSPETFSEAVEFVVAGADVDWFELEGINETLVVQLKRPLQRDEVKGRSFLQFEVIGEHRNLTEVGRTVVLVGVPPSEKEDVYMHFTKPLYEGSISSSGQLLMENIHVDSSAFSNEIRFELKGNDSRYFNLIQIVNTLRLMLSPQFSLANVTDRAYLSLEVVASTRNQSTAAALLIKLPPPPAVVEPLPFKQPIFERPYYMGSLGEDNALYLETIRLTNASYEPSINFTLMGDDLFLFELKQRDNVVDVVLKRQPIEGELMANGSLVLVVNAENGELRAQATVIIKVQLPRGEIDDSKESNRSEIFNRRWLLGHIEMNVEEQQVLSLNDIKLQAPHKVEELVFTLEGAEAPSFLIAIGSSNNITLRLLEPLPKSILVSKSQLFLQLHATSPAARDLKDSLLIFIELPVKPCIAPMPFLLPRFDSSEYLFAAKPNQLGVIGVVTATIEGANGTVNYHLAIDNAHLQQRLTIHSEKGELSVLSYINPGVYQFIIVAQNAATRANTTVKARLDVESILQCDEQHAAVASSLLNKYIEEELPYDNIMNTNLGDCHFEIFYMYPNDKEYVFINQITKMLSTIAIDRESHTFAHMLEPHLEIKLMLLCGNDTLPAPIQPRQQRVIDDFYSDIPFNKDITILRLMLIDVNDNAPQFVDPLTPKYLAYPESDICLELFPPHLIQVHATDEDRGLNADLRYAMRPNEHFGIDPITGVIYPKSNGFKANDYTELIVVATDRQGAADGLSTGIALLVRRLSKEYFSLLTFTMDELENKTLEQNLKELSEQSGYTITLLKHAIMPTKLTKMSPGRQAMGENATTIQKAWVYAFDSSEPVKSEELQRKLKATDDSGVGNSNHLDAVETFEELGLSLKGGTAESKGSQFTVYIVALTLLGIICAGAICFLVWRFYLRKRSTFGLCSSESSMRCGDSFSGNASTFANGTKETHERRSSPQDLYENSPNSASK